MPFFVPVPGLFVFTLFQASFTDNKPKPARLDMQ